MHVYHCVVVCVHHYTEILFRLIKPGTLSLFSACLPSRAAIFSFHFPIPLPCWSAATGRRRCPAACPHGDGWGAGCQEAPLWGVVLLPAAMAPQRLPWGEGDPPPPWAPMQTSLRSERCYWLQFGRAALYVNWISKDLSAGCVLLPFWVMTTAWDALSSLKDQIFP